MDQKQLYEQALKVWGRQLQEDMMIEECSELIKALLKVRRIMYSIETEKNENKRLSLKSRLKEAIYVVKNELADVEIMTGQMKVIYGDISSFKKQKLHRLFLMLQMEVKQPEIIKFD